MPNYKLIQRNKWISKKSPLLLNYGHGWCKELSDCLIDKDRQYCVMTRKINTVWGGIEHACIKSANDSDISWSEKQRIKNELFGENVTAIEVFPASNNLVDAANMYHLWILPEKFNLPFGLEK